MPPGLRPGHSIIAFALVVALGACSAPVPTMVPATVATLPLAGRTGARLVVMQAASRVRVVTAGLPGMLVRVSTPAGSGLAPAVRLDDAGRVRAELRPTGADGADEVTIVLNRDVRWDLHLPAGGGEQRVDLARARVTRLELGPSGLLDLRLPRPAGTLPVVLAGPIGTAVVTPVAGPVRFRFDAGADSFSPGPGNSWVTAGTAGAGAGAVAPGAVRESPGWGAARDRVMVRARRMMGSVLVGRARPEAR